jgi:hypothetical protein
MGPSFIIAKMVEERATVGDKVEELSGAFIKSLSYSEAQRNIYTNFTNLQILLSTSDLSFCLFVFML